MVSSIMRAAPRACDLDVVVPFGALWGENLIEARRLSTWYAGHLKEGGFYTARDYLRSIFGGSEYEALLAQYIMETTK